MVDPISFGFNFQKWTENTVVTMLNVPWNAMQDKIFHFGTQANLDTWIDNQEPSATITKFSLAKFQQDILVNMPINRAMKFNYLRAQNGINPDDDSRTYYYFINSVSWESGKATRLSLQLDFWQTYGYEVRFGLSFLERGHMAVANELQFLQYGRSYLSIPEGLDVGSEYRVVHVEHEKIIDSAGDTNVDPGYDVLVSSTLDLTQDPGEITDPSIDSAYGGSWQGLPTGADFYLFPTGNDLRTFMFKYKSKPWITQSISVIKLIPNMKRYHTDYDYGENISGDPSFKMYKASVNGGSIATPQPHSVKNLTAWRDKPFIENILGPEYKHLKKFFTFPYMFVELTTYSGSPLVLKPESWQDADAKVTELAAFMPPGERIGIYPARYNADAETLTGTQTDNVLAQDGTTYIDDNGDSLDIAIWLDSFPTLPIVNDMAAAYLASNRNGLAFSYQSAAYGRTRAQAGAQAGADVANTQIGNTARQSGIGIQNATQQAAISTNAGMTSALVSGASGLIGGSSRGIGPGTAASTGAGIANAGISASAQLESLNANNAARGASAVSDIQTAGQIRDTNQDFANFAAQGDYENTVAGIQAKVQDAMLTQPSVSGQYGGDAFNIINGLFGYHLKWKMANVNALRAIGNHWLRYGYAVHQYVTPPTDLRCMEKFTYWKLTDANLQQAFIPEGAKQIIKGIFEKGVTVYHNDPADIGNLPLGDNAPVEGIQY